MHENSGDDMDLSKELTVGVPDDPAVDLHSIDYWAARILPWMQRTVESIVATGKLLLDAEEWLRPAQFKNLYQDRLHMSERMSQRYRAIARHRVLADPTHASALPPRFETLVELERLPAQLLLEKLRDGSITPALMRKDVAKLRPPDPEREKSKRTKRLSAAEENKQLKEHVAELEAARKVADERDGSLFVLKTDSAADIVAIIVRTVSENKAKEIAAGINRHFKKAKPAG